MTRIELLLSRYETSEQGTFGVLEHQLLVLHTLELPWRQNQRIISCIPSGEYVLKPYSSAKYKNVYELQDVPGRSAILIHSGNYAGDKKAGWRSDVQGCVLVGTSRGVLGEQAALLNSRLAMDELRTLIGDNEAVLTITNGGLF